MTDDVVLRWYQSQIQELVRQLGEKDTELTELRAALRTLGGM